MSKNPPPKAAAKRAAKKAPPAARPRAKRASKKPTTESEVRAKQRRLALKSDPHSRAHLKVDFSEADVESVIDCILEHKLSLTAACTRLKFRYQTFRARMREDGALDKRVRQAIEDLKAELTDPVELIAIADTAVCKETAACAKVRVWARLETADRMLGGGKNVNLNHGGSLRIAGMADVLQQISAEGADVGPGPSKPAGS